MCGIAGIVRFDGIPVDAQSLRAACSYLKHRGPDDSGVWVSGENLLENRPLAVGLTVARLAVLDPSPSGHQPMLSDDGQCALAFNGEVYNYRPIRRDLTGLGRTFKTQTDTEVVLAACHEWGLRVCERFNGMWGLAYVDMQTGGGFLSRDRFGIKPLFYSLDKHHLLFASEIKALNALGDYDRTIDQEALVEHLQFGYISGSKTIYQGVRRLLPGHTLSFSAKGATQPECYYCPSRVSSESHPSSDSQLPKQSLRLDYSEAQQRLRRTLSEACICRRVSDVPIGAFLSGGLDSSIVVYHLTEALGRPVQTFSAGFEQHSTYDETAYARVAAKHLGTEHHEIVLSERDIVKFIPVILDHLGEPFGDSSIIPTALLSRFVSQHVKVCLSGDGSDELFGGYWRYLGHEALERYVRVPSFVRAFIIEPILRRLESSKSSRFANRVRQWRKLMRAANEDTPLARHIAWSRILSPDAAEIFQQPHHWHDGHQGALQAAQLISSQLAQGDPLSQIFSFDLKHQLPADILQKVDLASMMHSLEVRVPFLDPRVVELALSLPSEFKIYKGLRKRILLDAYRGRLPDEILDRPKQGFEAPIGEIFRGPLRPLFEEVVTRKTVDDLGLLSYSGIRKIFGEHLERRAEHADVLFALLSLCWRKTR